MWMISRSAGEALPSTGLVLILAAVLVTAASAVLMDHWSMPQDLVVTAGVQMLAGGVVATVAGWLWSERIESVSPPVWVAWLSFSLIVSGLGYLAYNYLMAHTGPVLASSYAYVNPPVALLVDAVVLGTQLGNATLLATAVVLTGAVIAMWATPSKSRQTAIPASVHSHGGCAA
jgi:drug/metabolite transporter (DMT)-like permease